MKLTNVFTFLKEQNIIEVIKTKLIEIIEEKKDLVKQELFVIIDGKAPDYKDLAVNWIMNKINLPFPMSLFKGKIKKTLYKNFDKLVDFIKNKIEQI